MAVVLVFKVKENKHFLFLPSLLYWGPKRNRNLRSWQQNSHKRRKVSTKIISWLSPDPVLVSLTHLGTSFLVRFSSMWVEGFFLTLQITSQVGSSQAQYWFSREIREAGSLVCSCLPWDGWGELRWTWSGVNIILRWSPFKGIDVEGLNAVSKRTRIFCEQAHSCSGQRAETQQWGVGYGTSFPSR